MKVRKQKTKEISTEDIKNNCYKYYLIVIISNEIYSVVGSQNSDCFYLEKENEFELRSKKYDNLDQIHDETGFQEMHAFKTMSELCKFYLKFKENKTIL